MMFGSTWRRIIFGQVAGAPSERPGLDVGKAGRLEHRAADDAREDRDDRDTDRDHRVRARRPEEAGDDDREHQAREREHDVDDAHQQRVREPARIPAQYSECATDEKSDRDRGQRDLERDLSSVDDARERVTPELVRPEWVRPRGAAELPRTRGRVRVERPDLVADQRDEDREADDAGADQAKRVPPSMWQAEAAFRKRAPRRRDGSRLVRRGELRIGRLAEEVVPLRGAVGLRHESEMRGSMTP